MSDTLINPQGKPVSAIEVGKRVRLKNDPNSPIMTVVSAIQDQRSGAILGYACGYFMPAVQPTYAVRVNEVFESIPTGFGKTGDNQMSQFQAVQLALECIELYIE